MDKKKILMKAEDILFFAIGSVIFAVAVNVFTAPNNIAPGGLTGIATMLNFAFGLPIGICVFVMNIPILIWGVIEIGWKLVTNTIIAVILSSAALDLLSGVLPVYSGNEMLAAIFGGVIEGIGLGLIFMRGGTTGGSDMVARLIGKRVRHLSMGKLMLFVDMAVVSVSAFVYGKIENALYALIAIFVSTKIIDTILYGSDIGTGKMYFIISKKSREIAQKIMSELDRGVTMLDSTGAYSGEEGETLLCAVRRHEIFKINTIIRQIDRNAFVIVGDAGEISGEGFRSGVPDDQTLSELLKKAKK